MRIPRLIASSVAALVLLSACGEEAAEEATAGLNDDGREASGEILPSSISDEMIATDRLDSQPPLLQDEPAAGASGSGSDAGAAVADAAVPPADHSGAVAVEPPPAAPPSVEDIGLPED